jgi:translation initiation factor 3 subunit E
MLAEKLNMESDKAELWIVNLIREARLDAKIDSKEGNVIMGTQVPSIYHQVIEKTKDLHLRSRVMSENMDKKGKGGAGAAGSQGNRRQNFRPKKN